MCIYVRRFVHICMHIYIIYTYMHTYNACEYMYKRQMQCKIIGLFCRISSLLYGSFAKETYNFIDPTKRSHPMYVSGLQNCNTKIPIPILISIYIYNTFELQYQYTHTYTCIYMYIYVYMSHIIEDQLQYFYCSVLQRVAVCCSVLQRVAGYSRVSVHHL